MDKDAYSGNASQNIQVSEMWVLYPGIIHGRVRLEAEWEAEVDLAAGEVVGYGILHVVDIGNPIIAAYVWYIQEVEHI